ncbi:MAG: DUF4037 domain-containing protein [Eubacteriales bacterium]|nr:DUF4037 domain-containing protein [Eubacteriales bacterium]
MNGLELSHGYYETYGKAMLENDFADVLPYLAVGFVGSGSEHYGFDDEVSRDHDYEPGFCIFLPGEDVVDRARAFQLERAYAKLPKEYCGVKRLPISPVGGNRNGVIRTADFYTAAVGSPDGSLSVQEWIHIPDYALAEAVNGEVFFDHYGEFSKIREGLMEMPNDIKLKRIAGNLLIMAQSGQYNFVRCLQHGEPEAAQLACVEFVNSAMKVLFLLNGRYMPYYKWSFRALQQIDSVSGLVRKLSFLLFADHHDPALAEQKCSVIEEIASRIITELQARNLTNAICGDLEKHAYSLNDMIRDSTVRNLHILASIT